MVESAWRLSLCNISLPIKEIQSPEKQMLFICMLAELLVKVFRPEGEHEVIDFKCVKYPERTFEHMKAEAKTVCVSWSPNL